MLRPALTASRYRLLGLHLAPAPHNPRHLLPAEPPLSWSPVFPEEPETTFQHPSLALLKSFHWSRCLPAHAHCPQHPALTASPTLSSSPSAPSALTASYTEAPSPSTPLLLLILLPPTPFAGLILQLLSKILSNTISRKPSPNHQMGSEVPPRGSTTTRGHLYPAHTIFLVNYLFSCVSPLRHHALLCTC